MKNTSFNSKSILRRAFTLLLCMLCIASAILPLFSYAKEVKVNPKIVRVGWYYSSGFQEGMTEDADKSGYAYEYLEKVADYTGWEYEYVIGDWSDLFSKLQSGEIDVLCGVSKTEERESLMLFPEYQMGADKYYLFQHKDNPTIKASDKSTFDGKKIGGVHNNRMTTLLIEWAQKNGINADIVYYDGISAMNSAFDNGEVDAITATENNITSSNNYTSVVKVGEEPIYLAVANNSSNLLSELNNALGVINQIEPYFLQNFEYKCYGKKLTSVELSEDEKEWIKTHDTIRVGYIKDYMPFCSEDESGNVQGVIATVVEGILDALNLSNKLKIEYVGYQSFPAMAQGLVNDEIDISFPTMGERKALNSMNITATSEVISVPFYIAYTGSFEGVTAPKIALNTNPIAKITETYPDAEIIKCKSATECLDAVASGDADCTIMASYRLQYLLNDDRYKDIRTVPFSVTNSYCIGVAKDNVSLLSLMDKGVLILDKSVVINSSLDTLQQTTVYTFTSFISDNWIAVFIIAFSVFLVIVIILILFVRSLHKRNKESAQHAKEVERLNELFNQSQDNAIRDFLDYVITRTGEEEDAVDSLLAFIGQYYKADRAYVFERDETGQYTVNTYEWCADGVNPEIDNLQEVPIEVVDPWMKKFREKGSFHISCDDEYAKKEPMTYEVLEPQGIQSLMAAPIVSSGDIIGFVGVDNPHLHIEQELYISVAATAIYHEIRIIKELAVEEAYKEELEKSRERAEAANNAKTIFLNNMSHDIRTPMNAIIGFSNLMEKHMDEPETLDNYLGKIKTSSAYLLSIINNVLDMARIESGVTTLDLQIADMSKVVDYQKSLFDELSHNKNLSFEVTSEIEHNLVMMDVVKVEEIMTNLVSNSVKYTSDGGFVAVSIKEVPSKKDGYATFVCVVKDNGIGMSKQFLENIFEMFSRERNTTDAKVVGTGLGMSIVKKLVDLMGGTISVESELGKGTSFTLTLDCEIAEGKEQIISEIDKNDAQFISFEGKYILLAEDNDLNAEIAIAVLEEAGFVVERAVDGVDCLNKVVKADANTYDVILTDIQMPNMDGYRLCEKIRRLNDDAKNSIPIYAVTANAFDEDKQKAIDVGMNGHFSKPIDLAEILKELSHIL